MHNNTVSKHRQTEVIFHLTRIISESLKKQIHFLLRVFDFQIIFKI